MWNLFPLLLIPIFVILVVRYVYELHHKITATEVAFLILLEALLVIPGFYLAKNAAMTDVEYWNGRVIEKTEGTESCCHCRSVCSGSEKNRSCTTVCDHTRDYWWGLKFSTQDHIKIETCSGSRLAPSRWNYAKIGEPAAIAHSYTNYLRADPDSLYNQSTLTDFNIPDYPRVYNIHYINRAFEIGNTKFIPEEWNSLLMEMNADLNTGSDPKKVNVIIVVTDNWTGSVAEDIEQKWLYGKLNDAIFVFGVDGEQIVWSEVITTPGHHEELKTAVRHEFKSMDITNTPQFYAKITDITKQYWQWDSIEDFQYLASAATPSYGHLILLYTFGILIALGGLYFAEKHSFFNDEIRPKYR